MYKEKSIYISGESGYHSYRIPALIMSKAGTLLAFCEGRKNSRSDSGEIDIVLRRSFDDGKIWQPMQVILSDSGMTVGNPAPVVDSETGFIWLLFCKNLGDGAEGKIVAGEAPRTVWVSHSKDDGVTWAKPEEITANTKDSSWTWYATGPCHGIQLQNGRMVIPCDHVKGTSRNYAETGYSHIIYSDDHGENWHIGGIAQPGTNESVIVQTSDGALYFNCRNYVAPKRRAYAWSNDNGDSFSQFGYDDMLVEPICQASMARFTNAETHDKNRVLFSNPASTERKLMTVRISYDECKTWNTGKILHEGPSAYSDLCIASDMTICCLYERGEESGYETITLAVFDLEWLTDGEDVITEKQSDIPGQVGRLRE